MDESIVERGEDVGNAKDKLSLSNLRTERDSGRFLLDFFGWLCSASSVKDVIQCEPHTNRQSQADNHCLNDLGKLLDYVSRTIADESDEQERRLWNRVVVT